MSKLKTHRLNIYLNGKERKKLNDLKNKYHLSYSTMANIITGVFYSCIELQSHLKDHYLYEDKTSTKTSIKPSKEKQITYDFEKPTMVFTNALKIFLNDDLKKYIEDERKRNKLLNMIYSQFQNTYDENWDGNTFCRQMPKFIRNNKDYIKKILESE